MAGDQITVKISAQDSASPVFKTVAESAKSMASSLEGVGSKGAAGLDSFSAKIKSVGSELHTTGIALTAFGAATTAAFGVSLGKSMGLESAMANVNSIARVSDSELGKLKGTILDLSVQLGAKPTELAAGLYDITSSGFKANDAMEILAKSAIAGKAGLTDTATAARAVTAVLNAYGEGANKAGDVSDVLFKVVDNGVITFGQLSDSLGRVLPIASSLNISLEQLGAAYAQLTLKGLDASEAETGISALMTAALTPTTAMTEAVHAYGYANAEALINAQGFGGYLKFLGEASGGTATGMAALTGNVRANNAALSLGADGAAGYTAQLAQMNSAAQGGAYTMGVFAIQSHTTQFALDQLGSSFGRFQIALGDSIAPLVTVGANALSGLFQAVSIIPAPIQETVGVIGALGGVTALTIGGLALMVPKVIELASAMKTLSTAMNLGTVSSAALGAALSPVGLSLIAIGATVGTGIAIWKLYNSQLDGVTSSMGKLKAQEKTYLDAGNVQRADAVKRAVDDLHAMEATINKINSTNKEGGPRIPNPDDSQYEKVINSISKVMADSKIDVVAYRSFLDAEFAKISSDPGHAAKYLDEIMTTNSGKMTQFQIHAGETGKSAEDMATRMASAGYLIRSSITNDLQTAIDATGSIQQRRAETASTLVDVLTATTDQINAQNKAYGEMIVTGLQWQGIEENLGKINMAGAGTQYTQLAQNMQQTTSALETGKRVIIDNTNAIAQNAQGLGDWANKLIGARGEYAAVDDLLGKGLINLQEYNAAQEAQVVITENAAGIALDMQAIQAKQAPLLAQMSDAQHVYIDKLREMPAAQQLITLGWMDASEAAKANQIITTAAAAANGELGASGQKATEQMIIGAAQADPFIKAMLEDMKLISVGADGTITVNFDQAKGAHSEIAELTKSIDALTLALGGVPPLHINIDGKAAKESIDLVTAGLNNVGNSKATAKVDVNGDAAKTKVDDILGTLAGLDGKTATISVEVKTAGTDLVGQVGNIAGSVVIPTTPAPITETPPYNGAPVTVPVQIDMQLGGNAVSSAQNAAQGAINGLGFAGTIEVPAIAKVNDVDTSAIDGIASKTITVTADVSQAVIGVYNLTTQIDTIADKSVTITADVVANDPQGLLDGAVSGLPNTGGGGGELSRTLTVNVEANDPQGLLGGGAASPIDALSTSTRTITVNVEANDPYGLVTGINPTGADLPAMQDSRTITYDIVANDPQGLLGGGVNGLPNTGDGGGLSRTLTVDVVANDPQSLISHAYDSGPGGVLEGLSRTLTVDVVANDPQSLISHGYDSGPGGVLEGLSRTLTVDVVANDPQGLLGGGDGMGPIDALSSNTKTITIDLVDNASEGIATVQGGVDGLSDKTVTIMGDATIALGAIDNVNSAGISDKLLTIFGDATIALGAVNNVNDAGVSDKSMAIFGDATIALGAIENVNNTAVYDKTMTISVVTAYSSIGSPSSAGGVYRRHGGIPGYASGGVMFEAGEAGREMAYFAGGGTALIPNHGVYMASPATYISPANATPQSGGNGGLTLQITVQGDVYGIDDLTEKVMRGMGPALVQAQQQHMRGLGVMA